MVYVHCYVLHKILHVEDLLWVGGRLTHRSVIVQHRLDTCGLDKEKLSQCANNKKRTPRKENGEILATEGKQNMSVRMSENDKQD